MESRYYNGVDYELPQARGSGCFAAKTRWRLLSEAIKDTIAFCPPERRALVANLQAAWVECEAVREELTSPPPQGVMEFLLK